MAIPTSPAVVVLENDQSIYTPNIQSSVVGIVGFADKGPVDTATLITSQSNLLNIFGRPNSNIPGQGLEGALEILEATNQIYFVRCASGDARAYTSAILGYCPAVALATSSLSGNLDGSSIKYTVIDNYGTTQTDARTVSLASSTGVVSGSDLFKKAFNASLLEDQDLMAVNDSNGTLYLVSRYAGSGASLTVSSVNGSTISFAPLSISGEPGTYAQGVTGYGGTAFSTGASGIYLAFSSVHTGTGYNLSSLRDGSIQGISIEIANKSTRDLIVVNSEGSARERFLVELSPSSPASVEYLLINDPTNNKSEYVYSQLLKNGSSFAAKNNWADKISASAGFTNSTLTVCSTPRFLKPIEGTYGLANGDSGYAGGNSTALIGTATTKTGMYALDDDSLNISLALIPGISTQEVQNALITLAESSKNFLPLLSPPFGLGTVQDAINWMNGRGDRTAALNSSYAAVCWPWVQVFNYYAAADEWYDPAIFAARQCVYTDAVAEPWFAPAGYRRGRLTKPSDVEVVLNQGDRDALYNNNINPINKEVQAGIVVYGQKTAQRFPSALDRINVRRLLIYIRKVLLQLGKPFQFEPSDPMTWELVEDAIRPFISDLLNRRAILEGDVKCDSSTNTPLRRDRNELWCSVTIKPTKAAETIVFEVNVTNQSATING